MKSEDRNVLANDVQSKRGKIGEHHESIWWMTVAPSVWAMHFLASYLTAAIYCEKNSVGQATSGIDAWPVRIAVLGYTLAALPIVLFVAWHGFQRHRFRSGIVPHDFDSDSDRHRFLGLATLLLSLLSTLAISFTALVFVFIRSCD